ncbi:MAG TPA: FecR domain-containing protein [Puia sp.]|nr:FecR domain-containing protein [Puia sp.]
MRNKERLKFLHQQFLSGNLSAKDLEELFDYFQTADEQILKQLISQELNLNEQDLPAAREEEIVLGRVHTRLKRHLKPEKQEQSIGRNIEIYRIMLAASVLICFCIGVYYSTQKHTITKVTTQTSLVDIKPGSAKALLKLDNGTKINLDDTHSGLVTQQGNVIVAKNGKGELIYQNKNKSMATSAVLFNEITTPRGGNYSITMSDGTFAMLDAQSSIKFPVNFTGNERLVEITGQVYFEVKHIYNQPFKVKVNGQVIEDLGTKFNINAYSDEPNLTTTLIEGSIRVSKETESVLLKPGEQAITDFNKGHILVQPVDVNEFIAWKNGEISFKNGTIEEIMRQVSRWYDVDVHYEGRLPARKFVGGISKNADLSNLLKILEFNNVHSKVVGKVITIKP